MDWKGSVGGCSLGVRYYALTRSLTGRGHAGTGDDVLPQLRLLPSDP